MTLNYYYEAQTKTCYRFKRGSREDETLSTLYVKKSDIDGWGIYPQKGLKVTYEQLDSEG